MRFRIEQRDGKAGDRSGTVYTLTDDAGTCRAEVWPFTGFNCLRWQVRTPSGDWGDLLYVAPDWEANPVPTRSGHPVLFPFPNRFRGGRFDYRGKEYQLPLNDSTKQNAIHGFTARCPWWVVGTMATDETASITGLFRLSQSAPESAGYWPTDATLTLTYRLFPTALRVEAVVENPSPGALPFGLGYHPYFRVPTAPNAVADEMVLWTASQTLWETDGGLPTGRQLPPPPELDFRTPRAVGPTVIDNLFGGIEVPADGGLHRVAALHHKSSAGCLEVHADRSFEELVLFTPQHRKAVAIEPYTCTTDAANLEAKGIHAGWRELPSGERFQATVEYRWSEIGMS